MPWELRDGELGDGELGDGDVPRERRYYRVLATAAYEAWVICCWPSGGSLDAHLPRPGMRLGHVEDAQRVGPSVLGGANDPHETDPRSATQPPRRSIDRTGITTGLRDASIDAPIEAP